MSKLSKIVKSYQNCLKLSKLLMLLNFLKILSKNCQNCQKKLSKGWSGHVSSSLWSNVNSHFTQTHFCIFQLYLLDSHKAMGQKISQWWTLWGLFTPGSITKVDKVKLTSVVSIIVCWGPKHFGYSFSRHLRRLLRVQGGRKRKQLLYLHVWVHKFWKVKA